MAETKAPRKTAPAKSAPPKPKEPTEHEVAEAKRQEKESRARGGGDPHAGREPRAPHPDPPPVDDDVERAKTEWKEARNVHPLTPYQAGEVRPEAEEVVPARDMTPEEIQAKEARGLVRKDV